MEPLFLRATVWQVLMTQIMWDVATVLQELSLKEKMSVEKEGFNKGAPDSNADQTSYPWVPRRQRN